MRKRMSVIFCLVVSLFTFVILSPSIERAWGAEEKYPSRSIDMFCAYIPGGYADLINRFFVRGLERYLKVLVIPGNKPGGGEVVAAIELANSKPDGYTVALLADGPLIITPLLGRAEEYRDKLRIVAKLICTTQVMAVSTDSPWKTFQEFMDDAHKNPGLTYGHGGIATAMHIRAEYLNKIGNLKMRGVPFKGDPEVAQAVLGNHVSAGFFSYQAPKRQADAGKMRILFSFTPPGFGPDPTLPTITSFFGKDTPDILPPSIYVVVPGKTPENIVKVLEGATEKVSQDPEFVNNLKTLYAQVCFTDSKTVYRDVLLKQSSIYKPILQSVGLKVVEGKEGMMGGVQ
jgi:tripartite-type tricarboxylate transporter receptor subunit TctC